MACSKTQKRIPPPFISQTGHRTYLFLSTATATAVRAVLLIGLTFSALAVTTPPVSAQSADQGTAEPKRAYNVPAGPLEQALTRFASTAGIELSVDSALIQGKTTKGLTGSFTVQEGFAQLLRGQGLQVIRNAGSVYSLQAISVSSMESGSTTTLPVMVVATAADKGTATEGTGSYTTSQSSYGKGQTLRELPQTVTVMTRQRIDDQQLKTLDDLMIRTPGVTVQKTDTANSSFFARGFQITSFQIDGNSPITDGDGFGYNTRELDLAMFDSVEVLRGSDALYGTSGEPGGAINLVRKKPTSQLQIKALAHAGSWNNYRGELDVGGSIMADGRVRGRLVGVYEDREYFYDYGKSDKQLLYGIVEADITNSTMFTVGADVMRQDYGSFNAWGLPRYSNGNDIGLRRSFYLGTPDDRWLRKNNKQFVRLDQAIGTKWTLGIEASRAQSKNIRNDMSWYGGIDPITLSGLGGQSQLTNLDTTEKTLDAVLKGSFRLLGREHKVIFGGNISRNNSSHLGNRRGDYLMVDNIFEFDPEAYRSDDPYSLAFNQKYTITQKGIYGSLAAKIADPLTLIVGGRMSWYKFSFDRKFFDGPTGNITFSSLEQYEDNAIFTPYLGLVFDLTKQWSTYASITETYKSQASSLKGPLPGKPLKPVTGRSYEVGVKGSLFNNRLNTAFAFFSIKRNGQGVQDPAYPPTPGNLGSNCCYLDDGRITSRGVDIEISGEIVDGWQILAGYTFNDNENKAESGRRYSTVTPKHLFKLWSTYELKGIVDGLKLGGGVTAQSSNYQMGSANMFNPASGRYDGPSVDYTFTEPGYVVLDLFAQYRLNKHWSATLNINNIFDKKYYQSVTENNPGAGNFYGEPRNFLASMRYSY